MNSERLLKIAEHLESGKLFHETFDFSKLHCGAAGCAMGEFHVIFPEK